MQIDHADIKTLVHALRTESTAYFRQWIVWLGVASGAGGMGLFSLAATLPDRTHAFQIFVPSLWAFLLGVVTAGLSILSESISVASQGEHFAQAHNREEINQVIAKTPEIFSSPRSIADEANSKRNELIAKSQQMHTMAEHAWILYRRWRLARNLAAGVSAIAFVCGMGWPITYITFGGKLVP